MNWCFGNVKSPVWPTVNTPVGQRCIWCSESIVEGDSGIIIDLIDGTSQPKDAIYHRECFLRTVFGSLGHQMQVCGCYGGQLEDPPGISKREAAKTAVAFYEASR